LKIFFNRVQEKGFFCVAEPSFDGSSPFSSDMDPNSEKSDPVKLAKLPIFAVFW
jgi:hypothetical protein